MKKSNIIKLLAFVLVALIGLGIFQYLRPLPAIKPTVLSTQPVLTTASALPWPAYGQSALASNDFGLMSSSGTQAPVPIASVAKIFTALAVLKEKPLALNDQGPVITIDKTDIDYYNYYYSNDGSVAKVVVGEQLSEYQALQALLLPSANNIADSLARWAFGSTDAYVTYANQMVKSLGLSQTTVGSASGFTASTTSTASDLVKAGLLALQNPVIAQIVSQTSATITTAGTIHNVNWLLGADGVNGIKTGNTNEAGGCYLFSTLRQVGGQNITVVGAVMGAPDLNKAIKDADTVIQAIDSGFDKPVLAKKNQIVGSYKAAWGATSNAISQNEVTVLIWKGQEPAVSVSLNNLSGPSAAGTIAGKITVTYNSKTVVSNVILSTEIKKPSLTWRLFRH